LSLLAYNPRNPWRRLVLPKEIDAWSLTSLRFQFAILNREATRNPSFCWLLARTNSLHARNSGFKSLFQQTANQDLALLPQ